MHKIKYVCIGDFLPIGLVVALLLGFTDGEKQVLLNLNFKANHYKYETKYHKNLKIGSFYLNKVSILYRMLLSIA